MTGKDFINFAERYLHLLFGVPFELAIGIGPWSVISLQHAIWTLFPPSSQHYCRKHKTTLHTAEEQQAWSTKALLHERQVLCFCHNYELNGLTVIISGIH